jgi:hypothetical protein
MDMKLFDYFTIDYPLPVPAYMLSEFRPFVHAVIDQDQFHCDQFEGNMLHYYINNSGKLFIDRSSFDQEKFTELEPFYYHGHLRVYTLVKINEESEKEKKFWLEYDLKITDSIVVCATMISPTKEEINELQRSL